MPFRSAVLPVERRTDGCGVVDDVEPLDQAVGIEFNDVDDRVP
ncbi:hypothetical protein ACFXP7_11280 [Microbacterium sp. P06]